MTPLSWSELRELATWSRDPIEGPTNAQARMRLFGQPEANVRVTLYRDHHAWCPYCQKVWLWLEEKQIPYRIEKVTMFCYGQKEAWYQRKVPSGMLPALELDGRMITESDDILLALEATFGSLGHRMGDPEVKTLRQLERTLFRAWCQWLCYPPVSAVQERLGQEHFQRVMVQVEAALSLTPGPYFLEDFSTVDVIFTPYLERMHASLFYYKGFDLAAAHPAVARWCRALQSRPTYQGTLSDFHTHAHDLPPQMGGCWSNQSPQALAHQHQVDHGPWWGLPDATYPEPATARVEALTRVVKHYPVLVQVNPAPLEKFDPALRAALTHLILGEPCLPPQGSAAALRYLRDRICVPRDMSIYAAKHLRTALETTAAWVGTDQGSPISCQHRRDQDPSPFLASSRGQPS